MIKIRTEDTFHYRQHREMAHGLFSGVPSKESSIVSARRKSSVVAIPAFRRESRTGSITQIQNSELYLKEALTEAQTSLTEGGIPIGCILVRQGQIAGRGRNRRMQRNSAILHAEMDCLEAVGRQPASFYRDCTLYTTSSPSAMSAGAIRFYGIPRVVIGENKNFHGDEALLRASNIQVDVFDSTECRQLLENFIRENPVVWNENIAHTTH